MEMKEPDKPFVVVVWGDAWSNDKTDYQNGSDYTPMVCHTPGWLMEQNEETTVVSRMYTEGDRYQSLFVIPNGDIIHIEEWK
jgi:hypothetical protein